MRATRADPPGSARSDPDRREVYSAALQQAEDLFDAAAAVGALARPLPLYYAVSQAGRAIAAAWVADGWRARGHGLREDRSESSWILDGILRFRVQPADQGVFGAVADSLGSGGLKGSVELGALWAALPLISAPPEATSHWLSALPVFPSTDLQGRPGAVLHHGAEHRGVLVLPDGHARDADTVNELVRGYPAATAAVVRVIQGVVTEEPTPLGMGVPLQWPSPEPPSTEESRADYIASLVRHRVPQYRYHREHWLVPVVGDARDDLLPLLLWWILLFGLSLLARYEPAAWRKALDPDAAGAAVLLESLLDAALEELPRLLTDALTHNTYLEPARF